MSNIKYKYHEDEILQEMKAYIDSTYGAHYAGDDDIQALDAVIAAGNGWGFVMGNIQKYSFRSDKKGQLEKDLMKVIHYAIFALHLAKRDAAKNNAEKLVIPPDHKIIPYNGPQE